MIRHAVKEDIVYINKIAISFNKKFNKTYDIEAYINDKNYFILVNEDEYVNGFLLAYNNLDEVELLYIVVDENNRNKNIGTKLLRELIKECSAKPIILEVSDKNQNAIKLYEKFDFKVVGVRKKYYENSDALVMRR